jgi:hypothetical protein
MSPNKKRISMNNVKTFLFSLALCGLSVASAFAQNESDVPLTAEKQKKIINNFADTLAKYYFFQDSVKMIVEELNLVYKNGMFSNITNDSLFAVSITKLIRAKASDNHLGVRYEKGFQPPSPSQMAPRPRDNNAPENPAMTNNRRSPIEFKILENNIGYLKIEMFDEQPVFFDKIDEVFENAKGTKALIVDLSSCRGGSPRGCNYVTSYLLQPNLQLTSIFQLINGNTIEFDSYSSESVKSERYTDKPVFILTGKTTFSAAENFCYDLQVLKRGIIVGVNTIGGANPGRVFPIGDSYSAFIPTGHSYNHITKTNWEGVGIIPDVLTSENEALSKAISLANEK